MAPFRRRVLETVAFLQDRAAGFVPQTVIVLGSGLDGLARRVQPVEALAYGDIPHFLPATGIGHEGRLLLGHLAGCRVAVLQGRLHYYEGYSCRDLTLPIRVLSLLGATNLVVTNAAGGLHPEFAPGTLMVIRDHLNFIPDNPLRGANEDGWGPRFPDLSRVYDSGLRQLALALANEENLAPVAQGVYVAIPGPSLETPAETRFLRQCGAHAVGMSTVPEVLVGHHAGMRILAVSVIANSNDPDNLQPIRVESVLETCRAAGDRLERLLIRVLQESRHPSGDA